MKTGGKPDGDGNGDGKEFKKGEVKRKEKGKRNSTKKKKVVSFK